MMSIADAFASVHRRLVLEDPDSEFLPNHLTTACVEVLPVAAATVSLFNHAGMPFPISVSSPDAATAEGFQFTTAEGPCVEAWTTQHPVVADEVTIATRWPLFCDELVAFSPFRAMVCVPLRHGLGPAGTLNLLLLGDAQFSGLNLSDVAEVNDAISQALLVWLTPPAPPGHDHDQMQPWFMRLNPSKSSPRDAVLHAVLMLADALGCTEVEALAALRARAFTTGRTADDIAADIVGLILAPDDLGPDEEFKHGA